MPSISVTSTTQPAPAGALTLPKGKGTAAEGLRWPEVAAVRPEAKPGARVSIGVDDWDVMFEAVRARLIHSVGERLGELPDLPHHSAELSASLVQAVVLDCVSALEQLHSALQQERSQRPTP